MQLTIIGLGYFLAVSLCFVITYEDYNIFIYQKNMHIWHDESFSSRLIPLCEITTYVLIIALVTQLNSVINLESYFLQITLNRLEIVAFLERVDVIMIIFTRNVPAHVYCHLQIYKCTCSYYFVTLFSAQKIIMHETLNNIILQMITKELYW